MVQVVSAWESFLRRTGGRVAAVFLAVLIPGLSARAALQFDVTVGYDNKVAQHAWFPILCEVFNDGPGFAAVIELTGNYAAGGQRQLVPVELPTGTRKRISIPAFAPVGGYAAWNVRLLSERGRVIAEHTQQQPKTQVPVNGFLMGAISRTFGGTPQLPAPLAKRPGTAPAVARVAPEQMPDQPLLLEGFQALYLNSERVTDLRPPQAAAIAAWVRTGGHLIVGVEQPGDINSAQWIRDLVPATLGGLTQVKLNGELQRWLPVQQISRYTNNAITADSAFDAADLPVVNATAHPRARVKLSIGETPLVIEGAAGRGRVTLLAFNPEREPFLSWRNRAWFWQQAAQLPLELLTQDQKPNNYQMTVDSLCGALVDSRQINKLPFGWLVLLLLAYLAIIGPVDQIVLRKLRRPMLTWITFPAYVVGFSFLVYYIGYALRAGENEWNELHIVDVLPGKENTLLRGRTFASVYSSANRTYPLRADTNAIAAVLRPEARAFGSPKAGRDQIRQLQQGNLFSAELTVPVWTTFTCANDWVQDSGASIRMHTRERNGETEVIIENGLDRAVKKLFVVHDGGIHEFPGLRTGGSVTNILSTRSNNWQSLPGFIVQRINTLRIAAQQRDNTFGSGTRPELENAESAVAISFAPMDRNDDSNPGYPAIIAPPLFDVSSQAQKGGATLVLAWVENWAPVAPLNQFSPRRGWRHTLLRVSPSQSAP